MAANGGDVFLPPSGPPPQHNGEQKEASWDLEIFHPPPGPPPFHHFREQGWRRLPLLGMPEWSSIDDLFEASKAFFAMQDAYKKTKISTHTEEGFYQVPGEKEFITLRDFTADGCPAELRAAAKKAWEDVFSLFSDTLAEIEAKLNVKKGALQRFADASDVRNGNERLGSSMLRCFRYDWNHDTSTVVSHGESGQH